MTQRVSLDPSSDLIGMSALPSTGISSSNFVHRFTSIKQGKGYRASTSRLGTAVSTTRPTTRRPQTAASTNTGFREAGYIVAIIEGRGESPLFSTYIEACFIFFDPSIL